MLVVEVLVVGVLVLVWVTGERSVDSTGAGALLMLLVVVSR